jgi:hypothetical protein
VLLAATFDNQLLFAAVAPHTRSRCATGRASTHLVSAFTSRSGPSSVALRAINTRARRNLSRVLTARAALRAPPAGPPLQSSVFPGSGSALRVTDPLTRKQEDHL